jgi:hypothetical protein
MQQFLGLDFVYHETPEFWAGEIYYGEYGGDRGWWDPAANVQPYRRCDVRWSTVATGVSGSLVDVWIRRRLWRLLWARWPCTPIL